MKDITQRDVLVSLWPYGEAAVESPVARLMRVCGVTEQAALLRIEALVDEGLADYGISPAYAWRTPEGEARLAELHAEPGGAGVKLPHSSSDGSFYGIPETLATCPCGEDCGYFSLGYVYCYGCDDHHRMPVAATGEPCPAMEAS